MIIKQYRDVIQGNKTQTRRMKDRYQVERVYSVVPKMYQPSVWYMWEDSYFFVWADDGTPDQTKIPAPEDGFTQLKIRITNKRTEPLQDITEADAIAEGIQQHLIDKHYYCNIHGHYIAANTARGCYAGLWDAINTKKGLRWDDNPTVVVYCFEVVK